MASTTPVVSLVDLQRFTLFTSLPLEIRLIIWRLSLSPRVVEVLQSSICTGFYSQAALPVALEVCRESRQAVEELYPCCFGSFLQPERVRFNFDLDILYLDISQEEEDLQHFFGVLKAIELTRLKYVAIDQGFLSAINFSLPTTALKRALKTMIGLKEMIVVCDVTTGEPIHRLQGIPPTQMKFYAEHETGKAEPGWPADVEELTDVQEEWRDWKPSNAVKITPVYGFRAE